MPYINYYRKILNRYDGDRVDDKLKKQYNIIVIIKNRKTSTERKRFRSRWLLL